ncbi:MAG: ATPase [Thermodesulfobacteriota bacterium]|nr:ATPase [Thermodesulfobacteriota bacterium]
MSGLLFGERLIEKKRISKTQLQKALDRQRLHGGRLGENMVALGFIDKDNLTDFFMSAPAVPQTVDETGLDFSFIVDLIIKHGLNMGEFSIPDIAARIKLPFQVIDEAIERLRHDQLVEVKGARQLSKLSYRFSLTEAGLKRATNLLEVSRYVGPAPVIFDDYRNMVEIQTIKNIFVDPERIRNAFSNLVVNEHFLANVGPAVSSGKAIFLYGPSGNGKTTIAETIGRILPGNIYMPYALLVEGEIVMIYDKASHVAVEPQYSADSVDQRWVLIERPVVMVGGEMTLKSLDLDFNPISKFYEAPLQMKANNGLFIVDDFGRQQVDPQNFLNRWIVPLERRTDFLSFHTGMKIEIPFDQLVVFSTNLEPRSLVDDAFLRRIRYKINIDHPDLNEYKEIFQRVCDSHGIAFNNDIFDHLIEDYYHQNNVKLTSCHCRDIIEHIIDNARYHGLIPELTKETLSAAWNSYFVKM